jgi:hypothetical protein
MFKNKLLTPLNKKNKNENNYTINTHGILNLCGGSRHRMG